MQRFPKCAWAGLFFLLGGCGWPLAGGDSRALEQRLHAMEKELATLPQLLPSPQTHQRIGFHGHEADPAWVMVEFPTRVTPEKVVLFPARLPVASDIPSPGFPPEFQIEISETPDFDDAVRIAQWTAPDLQASEQTPFLSFDGNGAAGRYLRIRVTAFHDDPLQAGRRYFRLGEIVVLEQGRNCALGCQVTSSASTDSARRWEALNLTDGYLWCLPLRGCKASPTNGYQSRASAIAEVAGQVWVEVELPRVSAIDEIHLVPAHPRDFVDLPGYGFPSHFRVLADAGTPDEKEVLRETDPPYPGEALPNPGEAQLMIPTPGLRARRVRVTCEALWRRGPGSGISPQDFLFALGELQVWRHGRNLAAGAAVQAADAADESGWTPAALVDGFSSRNDLLDWNTWLQGIEQNVALQAAADSIRGEMRERRENVQRRILLAAMLLAPGVALLAAVALLVVRARGARAQAELRARIARDLHDEIGASLSHLAIQSDLARRQLQSGELRSERLDAIAHAARETLDHMRDVIWLLVPNVADWTELSQRMESIADRLLDGVEHHIVVAGAPPDGKPAIAWSRDVLAFLKESLTNARRHAQASRVTVTITWSDALELQVADDGRGFTPQQPRRGGAGLENLERRAAALRGACTIDAAPGAGTRVRLTAPYAKG